MDRRTARALRSKAALKEAYLELFQMKEPEEITVIELCQKAGVNRSTFYAHYDHMNRLIQELVYESVERLLEDQVPSMWDLPLEDGGVTRSFISSYIHRFLDNTTLKLFCSCKNNGIYRTLIIRTHVGLTVGTSKDPVKYYAAYCHNAGVLNFLLEWFNDGFPIPEESAVELIHEFSKVMYHTLG